MDILDKNIYEYLANQADDRTILQMLKANVNFKPDERFFEKLMERRYPYLIAEKGNKSWRQLYLNTVHYISKLKEEYNYDYVEADYLGKGKRAETIFGVRGDSPELFYRTFFYVFDGDEGNFF